MIHLNEFWDTEIACCCALIRLLAPALILSLFRQRATYKQKWYRYQCPLSHINSVYTFSPFSFPPSHSPAVGIHRVKWLLGSKEALMIGPFANTRYTTKAYLHRFCGIHTVALLLGSKESYKIGLCANKRTIIQAYTLSLNSVRTVTRILGREETYMMGHFEKKYPSI